jgi:hypothetical protein
MLDVDMFFELFLRAETIVTSRAAALGTEKRLFMSTNVVVSTSFVKEAFVKVDTSMPWTFMPKSTIVLL